MRETDRQRILARRAAFVGTALAALGGCARDPAPAGSPPVAPTAHGPVVEVEEPPADAATPEEALPDAARQPRVARGAPSLDVPSDVSEEAKRRFEQLAERMRGVYALFDQVDVPERCEATDASCDARLRKLADDLLDLDDRTRYIIPVCAGSSESAKRFGERAREHADYVAELRRALEAEIQSALDAGGDAMKQRWETQQRAASMARPRVCLSFACMDW